jgi:hypothetical protein
MSIGNDRSLEAFYEYDSVMRFLIFADCFVYLKIDRKTLGLRLY